MPALRRRSWLLASLFVASASSLFAQTSFIGTTAHQVVVGDLTRSYRLYVPPQYSAGQPTPVVLAFHGAFEDATTIEAISGLTQKANQEGFIVVYPNGTGIGSWLFWNAGGWRILFDDQDPDDVGFVSTILDDLPTKVNVDASRVFATGYSLGGMLCYRLAAELPERIAAIAPVAGTITVPDPSASQPMPVMHFHGTCDPIIPYFGPFNFVAWFLEFESVKQTVFTWRDINDCSTQPAISNFPDSRRDGTKVQQWAYTGGLDGSEVILIKVIGGGHTWPGQKPHNMYYGKSTRDVAANALMWQFFQRHAKPTSAASLAAAGSR